MTWNDISARITEDTTMTSIISKTNVMCGEAQFYNFTYSGKHTSNLVKFIPSTGKEQLTSEQLNESDTKPT
jgi:hypothetical protein